MLLEGTAVSALADRAQSLVQQVAESLVLECVAIAVAAAALQSTFLARYAASSVVISQQLRSHIAAGNGQPSTEPQVPARAGQQ